MSRLLPLLLLVLAACASPSPAFRHAPSATLTLRGDVITVFHTATQAQAVRTNYRNKSARKGAFLRLVEAIETVSGCTVKQRSIRGDDVLITASIRCKPNPA